MFTGIIQTVGKVVEKQQKGGDIQFIIQTNFANMSDVALGDSIACNGVCLTVTSIDTDKIAAIEAFGVVINQRIAVKVGHNSYNKDYLQTKADKFKHL